MAQQTVLIKKGSYRNGEVVNKVFPVVKAYDPTKGYITVWGSGEDGLNITGEMACRIKVSGEQDFELYGDATDISVPSEEYNRPLEDIYFEQETEEEAIARITRTFEVLEEMTDAAAQGIVRGLIVCGPPGIGKSFGVEKVLQEINMFSKVKDIREKYTVIKGSISPPVMYKTLYNYRDQDNVVVFDDADGCLYDEDCLNLLKSALDSGHKRKLCWMKQSRMMKDEGIPDSFNFSGSVIFLTNISFEKTRGKIADHLKAMQSRCHYLDLEIGTQRDQILRIKQIVRAGMLNEFYFENGEEQEIVNYIIDNVNDLRELSLRAVKKIADLRKAFPKTWMEYAESGCMKKEAKFRRLLNEKAVIVEAETIVVE